MAGSHGPCERTMTTVRVNRP